jgi:transposase
MASAATRKEEAKPKRLKTLKLRLRPTPAQKQALARMAGCCRFTYNKAVAMRLAQGSTHKDEFRLRDRLVTHRKRSPANGVLDAQGKPLPRSVNNFFNNKPWLLECPKDARQGAVHTALANIKACFSNLKAGNIDRFEAPMKRKKAEVQKGWSIEMGKNSVHKDGDKLVIWDKYLKGDMRYFGTKQLHKLMPDKHPTHDAKVQKTRFGEYFLVLSLDVHRRERAEHERVGLVVGDPGVRKTLTTYSPDFRESFELGKGQASHLTPILLTLDRTLSRRALTTDAKERRTLARRAIRLRKRVAYLQKEFRDQVASFLTKRYNVVLLPKLDTQRLAMHSMQRRLKTKTVRSMMVLGHATLFSRVKEKAWEHGCTFMQVTEPYTSQTCVKCGHLHKTSSETYICSQCGFKCDRDLMGALGILLRTVRLEEPSGKVVMRRKKSKKVPRATAETGS